MTFVTFISLFQNICIKEFHFYFPFFLVLSVSHEKKEIYINNFVDLVFICDITTFLYVHILRSRLNLLLLIKVIFARLNAEAK